MSKNYIHIYNSLVNLTRNKDLYKNFTSQDSFSDRLVFFLLHFAFLLKVFKDNSDKSLLQDIYDYIFKQLELSIREIGYGDQSINKKMKDYINLFYGMIDKIHDWDNISAKEKLSLLSDFIDKDAVDSFLLDYFEKYKLKLTNNTLNSYIKGVIKH